MDKKIIYCITTDENSKNNEFKIGYTEQKDNQTPEEAIYERIITSVDQAFFIDNLKNIFHIISYSILDIFFANNYNQPDQLFHIFLKNHGFENPKRGGGKEWFILPNGKLDFDNQYKLFRKDFDPIIQCKKYYIENNKYNRTITPPVAYEMINKINKNIFKNKNVRICLFAACENFVYNILLKKFDKGLKKQIQNKEERINYIINNILYIVCIDKQEYNNIIEKDSNIKNIELIKNIYEYKVNKKFDYILMNPPYSNGGGNNINLDFTKKCLEISNNSIIIMPCSLLRKKSSTFNKYINIFDKYLISAEETDSNIFTDTNMQEVAIYKFGNKDNNQKIIINHTYGEEIVDSLNNISGKINNDNITEEILNYLLNFERKKLSLFRYRKDKMNFSIEDYINSLFNNENNIILLSNNANKQTINNKNPKFITNELGQIFDNIDDFKKFVLNTKKKNKDTYKTFIVNNCSNMLYAINYKKCLNNNLFRWILLITQTDQNITLRQYKYIPVIDYSKVNSDEDILRLCGCPENKIKEYIEYINNIMKDYPLK